MTSTNRSKQLCKHCGERPVSHSTASELCKECADTVRRERAQFLVSNEPDDERDWGIPGPEVRER